MLKNYFKIAWRNLKNHKSASILNITGLSLGMAAAVLILLWVQNEVNFDNYHTDAKRIYHVKMGLASEPKDFGGTPLLLAETVKQQVPEIEKSCRFLYTAPTLAINNNFYKEKNVMYVDKEWFDIFHYDFVEGNSSGFSQNPNSVILTESLAKKYFGNNNALGQVINIDSNICKVQAVVKDNPANSSFQFSVFLPMEMYLKDPSVKQGSWLSFPFQTFLQLIPNADVVKTKKKIETALNNEEQLHLFTTLRPKRDTVTAKLTSLSQMHFNDNIGTGTQGDKKVVLIFSVLGFLLLMIACINYVNLTTAKASQRSKEVGIKKIMGAERKDLFAQFMTESVLTGIIALILTLLIVKLSLPWFNNFTEKKFVLSLNSIALWKLLGATLLITVLLTGIYPALLLSSFKPLNVLKGFNILSLKNTSLRKILVMSQFTIAVALTICTIVILRQLYFIQNKNEGYNRSQIFSVSLPRTWHKNHSGINKSNFVDVLKNELTKQTAIENVAVSNDDIQNLKMSMGGIADWSGRKSDMQPNITPLAVDADFRNIFKLELKEGRWFQPDNINDKHNYILNETAVAELEIRKPYIGQYFSMFNDTGHIIGIVKDFHFRDYHQKISSTVLFNNPDMKGTFFIQANTSKMKQALAGAESTWKTFFPQEPFEYNFMDQEFEKMYQSDLKTSQLVTLFSGLAIFISCLGLFGLVAFVAEQRTKEIGIRKVLGATITSITTLLSKDFIMLVMIAVIIASPIAWWAMNKWLETFAYRINISWWMFAAAGTGALILTVATVSFRSIKAAMANPVKSLRAE